MADFATVTDVANLWRPLSSEETTRATTLLGMASRRVRRDFPDIDARILAGTVDADDVRDVVASLVLPALGGPPVPGARSWSVASGAESRSVSLSSGSTTADVFEYLGWMLDILNPGRSRTAIPVAHMPAGGGVSRLFPLNPEVYS